MGSPARRGLGATVALIKFFQSLDGVELDNTPTEITMADIRPHGATRDALYGFSKVFVRDLDAMGRFYEEVFGLVPFNRHADVMLGRKIDEISYQATSPGGGALTLIHYVDGNAPSAGESVQGFTTNDIEALVLRAERAGGRLAEPIRRIEEFRLFVAFVLDPEGHINEVVQLDA